MGQWDKGKIEFDGNCSEDNYFIVCYNKIVRNREGD